MGVFIANNHGKLPMEAVSPVTSYILFYANNQVLILALSSVVFKAGLSTRSLTKVWVSSADCPVKVHARRMQGGVDVYSMCLSVAS